MRGRPRIAFRRPASSALERRAGRPPLSAPPASKRPRPRAGTAGGGLVASVTTLIDRNQRGGGGPCRPEPRHFLEAVQETQLVWNEVFVSAVPPLVTTSCCFAATGVEGEPELSATVPPRQGSLRS
jgi:hypothetical protein